MSARSVLRFPNPVNEVAARVVAAGVVVQCAAFLATRQGWLLVPLSYGFLARVAAGPRFSPLGLLATRVVAPRLPTPPRLVPGPPKRFAQGIGATLSTAALLLHAAGSTTAAAVLVAGIAVAASLESALAYCIGCQLFALLMRVGVIPASVCEACADIRLAPTR
ncbi:MAG TPA: DUF4395 domain-containing protein [Acidimicrobiales bacterium]